MPVQYSTERLDELKSSDTFALVEEEVRLSHSKSTRFRDVLSNQEVFSKKPEFITAWQKFRTNPAHDPYDPLAKPYTVWDLSLR